MTATAAERDRDRAANLTPEQRQALADYHALAAWDLRRFLEYGDMARARRGRELNRLGDALITAGVPVDRNGAFPPSTPAELADAFERVLRPRYTRWQREPGARFNTPHAAGTRRAWTRTARHLGVTLETTTH